MGADHQSVGCGSELRVSRSHHYLAVAQSHRSMGLIFPGPIDEGVVVGFEAPMREPVRIASTRHERDVRERRSPLLRWPDSAIIASGRRSLDPRYKS